MKAEWRTDIPEDDDYISRRAAKVVVMIESLKNIRSDAAYRIGHAIENGLDNIHAADVQPVKHGHWIKAYVTRDGTHVCNCSECGDTEAYAPEYAYKYCPECGAIMDGTSVRHPALGLARSVQDEAALDPLEGIVEGDEGYEG